MRIQHKGLWTLLVSVFAVTALIASPTMASASSAAAKDVTKTTPLTVRRFDVKVANANGYRIVVKNGAFQSVKVSNKPIHQAVDPTAGVSPLVTPIVEGNCGIAFLHYNATVAENTYGVAALANGMVCYSGGPSDYTYLW